MFDVKQLRVLKEVAEHGSFSAAAEALSYTQPAVSQQIAALERRAGTTLVDRGSRGVRLTDAGRALVDHADAVLARLAAAEAELEAIAGVRGGRVRLSAFPTAAASILPPAVALFGERHPEVELSFVEQEPEEAVAMLRSVELEVAIVYEFELLQPEFDRLFEGIELHYLVEDPMYIALPRDHPCARKQRLRVEDLAGETWIQSDSGDQCGRLHRAACVAAGFEPRSLGFESDDYNVVQGLIAAGVGISLLPALALTNVRDDIVIRALGRRAPSRRVAAATLAGRFRSPATEAMLGILEEVAARFELPAGAAVAA
jgi:DNA-binding transcriptional LysR family regulator